VKNLKKRISLNGKKYWCKFIKWCKNLGVDSSCGYCTLELGLVKEYITQIWFGIWGVGVGVGLLNYIKNEFVNSLSYLFIFKHFNYIIGYWLLVIVFI